MIILFACEVAAAIWGFMNRDTVSNHTHTNTHTHNPVFHCRTGCLCIDFPPVLWCNCSVCGCVSKTTCPTPDCPQISKELINFYDSAYIKAVDVSGSPSKDTAIKVLDVFHNTVRHDGNSLAWYHLLGVKKWQKSILITHFVKWPPVSAPPIPFSSTAVVKEMTPLSSNKSPAPCVPESLQKIFWDLRYTQILTKIHNEHNTCTIPDIEYISIFRKRDKHTV